MSNDLGSLMAKGIEAAEKGNTLVGLVHLEAAAKLGESPLLCSYLGFCLAGERRQVPKAVSLCRAAIQKEPGNPMHYLNLGRVYNLAGQKGSAIQAFRKGLKAGPNPQIIAELKNFGVRKPPVLKSLARENPLNKILGLVFHRLRLR